MNTENLYEQMRQRLRAAQDDGMKQGVLQGFRRALLIVVTSHYGAVPDRVATTIEATHDTGVLGRWLAKAGTCPVEEFTALVVDGAPNA